MGVVQLASLFSIHIDRYFAPSLPTRGEGCEYEVLQQLVSTGRLFRVPNRGWTGWLERYGRSEQTRLLA